MTKINSVMALPDFRILASFNDGVTKLYDMHRLLADIPQFEQLRNDENLFYSAHKSPGGYGVIWNNELDLAAEEVYTNGTAILI